MRNRWWFSRVDLSFHTDLNSFSELLICLRDEFCKKKGRRVSNAKIIARHVSTLSGDAFLDENLTHIGKKMLQPCCHIKLDYAIKSQSVGVVQTKCTTNFNNIILFTIQPAKNRHSLKVVKKNQGPSSICFNQCWA